MRLPNVCDICSFNENGCEQNHYVCDAVSDAYQQGKAAALEEFLKQTEFLREYKIDGGKLVGLSIGECLDEIANSVLIGVGDE